MSKPQPLVTTAPVFLAEQATALQVLFPEHAAQLKAQVLEDAGFVEDLIESPAAQTIAAEALSKCQGYLKQLEGSRKMVKAPFYDAGLAIDAFAKEQAKDVETEVERIKKALSGFAVREQQRVLREQREAAAEQERLRKEAQDKIDAEARRVEELQKQAAAATASEAERAAAQAKLDEIEFAEPVAPAPAPAPIYVAPAATVKGLATKTEWDFEVVNIHLLYAALPHLVKLEPAVSLIKGYINAGGVVKPEEIPGIRCFQKTAVQTRAARPVVQTLEG